MPRSARLDSSFSQKLHISLELDAFDFIKGNLIVAPIILQAEVIAPAPIKEPF